MIERFTAGARLALFHARAAAGHLGSNTLEPEHLLLGVIDEGQGRAVRLLARTCGVIDDLRADIVRRLTSRGSAPDSREVPFSATAMHALEYSAEEADALFQNHIGTEHLLLGVMREERSVAATVLAARGLGIDAVRDAIREPSSDEAPEFPGPPPTPANTYKWPQIPFVPSRTVHILHSGMPSPAQPVVNHPGPVFSAYGFTLQEIIVRAWEGNRWHVEIPLVLRDDARFDFLMVLPQAETTAACLGLLSNRAAIRGTRHT